MQNSTAASYPNLLTSNVLSAANASQRSADYTIKGFLYQFNKTIEEILKSDLDEEVTVEGIVEDIDIFGPNRRQAIQCKYHEAQAQFRPSLMYKPLLQMMDHFHKNMEAGIQYRLYAFFPSKQSGEVWVPSQEELEEILSTEDKKLSGLAQALRGKVNLDRFISVFLCEFGCRYEELVKRTCQAFEQNGVSKDDIEALAYPNAINEIAKLSIAHVPEHRKTTKRKLLSLIKSIKRVTLSRWTRELQARSAILKAKRAELRMGLNRNVRARYFVISSKIERFKDDIVVFIQKYFDTYHYKDAHTKPPVFLLDCSEEEFSDFTRRMMEKRLFMQTGFAGPTFYKEQFFRPSIAKRDVRVTRLGLDQTLLQDPQCDDLFIVSDTDYTEIVAPGTNIEKLAVNNIQELEFLLGLRNASE
ncbi:hypothetical protein ACLESD_00210 [Pyxidicoccus sp. 3LFB2]